MTKETLPYPQGSRNPPSAIPPQPPSLRRCRPMLWGRGYDDALARDDRGGGRLWPVRRD